MRDVDGDISSQNRAPYNALRETVRERLAAYLGADVDEIAIVRNTSEANNVIAAGLDLGPGDEVLLFDQNHASNGVSWDVRAARHGFTVRRVAVPAAPSDPSVLLEAFRAALTPATRVLSITDVSNTTGLRLPVAALCSLARERGIHAHVDGAQSFGALHFNLHAIGCDSYSGSAHKWFMGPKEAGVLYVRSERQDAVWPSVVSVGWGNGARSTARGARKFEALGQRNDATIAGMAAALDFHEMIGPEAVEARVFELAARLRAGLAALPGAEAVTPASPALSAGVIIFRLGSAPMGPLVSGLYDTHRLAVASTGGLRISPHVYNTFEDVDRAVAGVAALLAG